MGTWRVRNGTLIVLWIVFVLFYLDRASFSVAAPFIAKELQLSSSQMGMIMSAFLLGYGFFQILGGFFVDRFGSRVGMVFATGWWAVFVVLTGLGGGFISLLVIRFFFGIGESFQPPASFKLVSSWFPKKELVKANSLMLCAIAFAPACAPLLVMSLMERFGWRMAFIIYAVPAVLFTYVAWKYLRDTPEEHPSMTTEELEEIHEGKNVQNTATIKMSFLDALRVPNLLLICMIYAFFDVTYWGFMSWLPSYLVNVRHFASLKMGFAASVPYLTGFFALLAANMIGKKVFRDNKQLFLSTIWVIGGIAMYLAYASVDPTMCVTYLAIAGGIGIFMTFGPFWALVMEYLPKEKMGFFSSLINGAGKIGGAASPTLIGLMIDWTGSYSTGFMLMEGCLLIAAILVFFGLRNKVGESEPIGDAIKN